MGFEVNNFSEIVGYTQAELGQCSTPAEFEAMARDIAEDEGLDVALVRAIGKGSLTDDYDTSKPFIRTYLGQVENDITEREERRKFLANLFGVTEDSISSVYAWKKINKGRGITRQTDVKKNKLPLQPKTPESVNDRSENTLTTNEVTKNPPLNTNPNTDEARTCVDSKEPAEKLSQEDSSLNNEIASVKNSKVELTDEDKKFICEYVEAATDETEKKERRLEMAKLFETGVRQIAAITAWTKIRAQKATTENFEAHLLKQDEIEFIKDFVFEASTAQDELERCQEMAEMFGTDVSLIETVVLKALLNDSVPEDSGENEVLPTVLKGGAHVEYDNPEKNKWREKMKEFILDRTTEQERARMKVLCLPGKRWLEATHVYLDLGFKAENIHGVERDKTARNEFEEAAKELGCQAHFGDLTRFVKHPDTPAFDVVSLDFLGPFSEGTLDLVEKLKPTQKQLLLTNFMAKREGSGQDYMRMAHEVSDTNHWRSNEGAAQDHQALVEKLQIGRTSTTDLRSTRDSIWRFLSRYHASDQVNPFYKDRMERIGDLFNCTPAQAVICTLNIASPLITCIEQELVRSGISKNITGIIGTRLQSLLVKALLQEANIKNVEMHEYRSGSGAASAKYISDFIELEVPIEEISSMKHSVRFLLDAIEASVSAIKSNENLETKNSVIVISAGILRVLVQGRNVASIPIKRLSKDCLTFMDICRGNLWDRIILGKAELPTRKRI